MEGGGGAGCHQRAHASKTVSGLAAIRDVGDRLAHGRDLLGIFVGDFDLELFFESHDQLDRIERIGAEVIDERSVIHNLLSLDAQLFGDNRLDLLFNRAHFRFALNWMCFSRTNPVARVAEEGAYYRATAPRRPR